MTPSFWMPTQYCLFCPLREWDERITTNNPRNLLTPTEISSRLWVFTISGTLAVLEAGHVGKGFVGYRPEAIRYRAHHCRWNHLRCGWRRRLGESSGFRWAARDDRGPSVALPRPPSGGQGPRRWPR